MAGGTPFRAPCADDAGNERGKIEALELQMCLASDDTAEIEEILDHARHMGDLAFDDFPSLAADVGIQIVAAQNRRGRRERGERIAKLVAQRRDEFVLRAIGRLNRILFAPIEKMTLAHGLVRLFERAGHGFDFSHAFQLRSGRRGGLIADVSSVRCKPRHRIGDALADHVSEAQRGREGRERAKAQKPSCRLRAGQNLVNRYADADRPVAQRRTAIHREGLEAFQRGAAIRAFFRPRAFGAKHGGCRDARRLRRYPGHEVAVAIDHAGNPTLGQCLHANQ